MKKSFFERLTGSVNSDSENEKDLWMENALNNRKDGDLPDDELFEDNEDGQLTVDMYQTDDEIILQAIVAGVKESDLDISIAQDMITIRGERESKRTITKEDYYCQELYWGTFSRSMLLPQEVDPDKAIANLKDGVLTIKLPKLDKERVQKIKIKND